MIFDKQALGSGAGSLLPLILAQCGQTVAASTMEQDLLGCLDVLRLALPCLQDTGLQRTAVGEGEAPRFHSFKLVDGIQVCSGNDFRLASGEERDPWDGHREVALECGDGCQGNLFRGVFLGTVDSRQDHVGLEQGPLEVDVMVAQGLVHGGQGAF